MFAPQWSLKAEYLYFDLGTARGSSLMVDSFTFLVPGVPAYFTNSVTTSHHFNGYIARLGVNYHF